MGSRSHVQGKKKQKKSKKREHIFIAHVKPKKLRRFKQAKRNKKERKSFGSIPLTLRGGGP